METQERTCAHCGATENLINELVYAGGVGLVLVVRCLNLRECWAREATASRLASRRETAQAATW